jgi:hypothetical protein
MKRILTLWISLVLLALPSFAVADEVDWSPVKYSTSQQYVMNILGLGDGDLVFSGNAGSILQYNSPTSSGYIPNRCSKYGEYPCTENRLKDLQANFVLPLCKDLTSTWCIRSFSFQESDGNFKEASFIKYIDGYTFPADSRISLPEGGRISIWRIGDDLGDNSNIFALKLNGAARWFTGEPFYFQSSGNLYPLRINRNPLYQSTKLLDTSSGISFSRMGLNCENAVYVSDGECGVLKKFPQGLNLKISFVVPNSITGFISSRSYNTRISSQSSDEGNKLVTIQGEPIRIPRLGLSLTRAQAEEVSPNLGTSTMNWMAFDNGQGGDALNKIAMLRNWANDRASGFSTVWNFVTLDSSNSTVSGLDTNGKRRIDYYAKCKIPQNELLGMVSTNSMILDPGPPNFVDEEFVYNVAGMHYEPDGVTPIRGYYTLSISKTLANCLYGNSGVPIRATVNITNEEEKAQSITTETVKLNGDFYSITIAGFTFSKPVIHVKYLFDSKVKPSITPSAEPSVEKNQIVPETKVTQRNVNITTIICIRGKKTIYIKAVVPKCPSGYKKK